MTPRPHLLLIDDSRDFREGLRLRLTNEGFDVSAVGSGREGLDLARQGAFDLVLLDMLMPEQDGIATYQELRANPYTRHLPLILLTGIAREDHWEPIPYDTDGPAFIMGKPYDHTDVIARINQVLNQGNGGAS